MSSTPEENRPPEQPRWGQRRPEGSVPDRQPDEGAHRSPGQSPGYGRSAGYGESAGYGQPQGWSQPGHGQQGAGGHAGASVPAQKPRRPLPLILAMVLMLLAGATAITLSILSFLDFTSVDPQDVDPFWVEVVEESQAQQGPGAEELTVQDLMLGFGVMVLLGGIILAALYTVFAFVGTMTGNVGRILATIFLSGSVFMILLGPENLIVTGLSLAAIVALWLPASNTYVRERKAWKDLSRPGSPYGGPGQPGPQHPQGWAPQQAGPYPQGPSQQSPYQPGPYEQGPDQQSPYQQGPYQQSPYQPGPYPQGPQQGPYGSAPDATGSGEDDQRPQDSPYGGSNPR